MTVFGIVAFVVALLLSVMLHEAGHFVTARHYGMKATHFFVGFGPTLWSRTKGETEYGVKAIPAGGFVKIVGMTPLEDVDPGDEERAFFRQPAGRRTVVLAAGSTVHFLIAVVLIFGTVVAFGVQRPETPVLVAPQDCLVLSVTAKTTTLPSDKKVNGACPAGTVPGVAAAAGFRAGDRVLEAGGQQVATYKDFTTVVRASAGKPLTVVVDREGARQTLTFTPVETVRPDANDPSKDVTVGAIGVGLDPYTFERVGVLGTFTETGSQLKAIVVGTVDTLTKKLGTISKVYSADRDPTGFVGVYGVGRVSGEVFSAPIPVRAQVVAFLLIMAGLNLFVGIFNLLPLLPLDGGHIAILAFEQARDRLRRARGYVGELQRVDLNKLMPLTLGVVVFFGVFTLWLLGADIVNPISIN